MAKKYTFILCFFFLILSCLQGFSQNELRQSPIEQEIKDLSIFPNPVASGTSTIHILSKKKSTKIVQFYSILGKRIFSEEIVGKELNLPNLNKGVYVLKIIDNGISQTRKLVVK